MSTCNVTSDVVLLTMAEKEEEPAGLSRRLKNAFVTGTFKPASENDIKLIERLNQDNKIQPVNSNKRDDTPTHLPSSGHISY